MHFKYIVAVFFTYSFRTLYRVDVMFLYYVLVFVLTNVVIGDVLPSSRWPQEYQYLRCRCDQNATYKACPTPCPKTCLFPGGSGPCRKMCLKEGCECKGGYYLSDKGKCVLFQDCPGAKCCSPKENFVFCNADCPTKYCPMDDSRAIIACSPPYPCKSGCSCKEGYLKLHPQNSRCVLASNCPPVRCTRPNELWDSCPTPYISDRCADIGKPNQYNKDFYTCRPQCVCKPGFYRNDLDVCVPKHDCAIDRCGDKNATYVKCPNPCPGTCANPEGVKNCLKSCVKFGCECKPGFVLSDTGKCIQLKDCPDYLRCNGDRNATFKECPSSCPRTCKFPGGSRPCSKACLKEGCECKEGYYLSEEGKCVQLPDCPGAKACSLNETFVFCNVGCPNNYCPVDDSRAIVACDPPFPCPSGCSCKGDYLRLARGDDSTGPLNVAGPLGSCLQCLMDKTALCILAYECPPVPCTRPNEEWNKCPPPFLIERCSDIGVTQQLDRRSYPCRPRCTCKPGFYRDDSDTCVPKDQCPFARCDDKNATYVKCPNPCPGTCANPEGVKNCLKSCVKFGCECKPGFVVSDTGKCIQLKDCPDYLRCNGDRNATFKECPSPCPRTCKFPGGSGPCSRACLKEGCECKEGYYLSEEGKCVQLQDCPGAKACSLNETFVFCNVGCPSNYCPVDDSRAIVACSPPFPCASGCSCKGDYLRLARGDDRCILAYECPPVPCTRPNEEWNRCPPPFLIERCSDIGVTQKLDRRSYPCRPQCTCKPGFYRDDSDTCVPKDQCPPNTPICGVNEELSTCKIVCPPQTCESIYTLYLCSQKITCELGCNCLKGYLRNSNGVCVPSNECPRSFKCGYNERRVKCRTICPPQVCENSYTDYACGEPVCEPGCDCLPNYLRNSSGICIPNETCPPPPVIIPTCGINEELSTCKIVCPPQTCESIYTLYLCSENIMCELGCNCLKGYLRNSSGVCVPSEQCSKTPPLVCEANEIASDCKITCPPQTCDSIFTTYNCDNVTICKPGCNCIDGFLRNDQGICTDKCFSEPTCDIPVECRSTCSNPNPQNCKTVSLPKANEDGCKCKPGYILSDANGPCIQVSECPADGGCNGDPNSIATSCPWPCPSSCNSPNAGTCGKKCVAVGCQCKPGFILSDNNKKCIRPDQCKSGNPCGVNGTYSECAFRCPNQNCPEDDSLSVIACKPGRPCPPGCLCKEYYRREQSSDKCVLASDCPPVECTRPNEVFNPCASECLAEDCSNVDQKPVTEGCVADPNNCQPKCVCVDGYFRNANSECVPKKDCPKICSVSPECRPTCAVPNPPGCPFTKPSDTNKDGCKCQQDYILSDVNGKCIKTEDCPANRGCNGDPNSIATSCPWPCPSSCNLPNAGTCGKKCVAVGCQCKPGFILSDDNKKCIRPDQCKSGNPCGVNGTYSECAFRCPNQNCPEDDSLSVIACKPGRPCPPGCLCKEYYRREQSSDKCILASDCPPVECTRSNEVFNPCASECLAEDCSNVDQKPVTEGCVADPNNCQPKCVCVDGYFRNGNSECVPKKDCPKKCSVSPECRPTCAVPNPPGCPFTKPSETNEDGCKCQQDFILSDINGKCIKIEDCPANNGCNGDRNATVKKCPLPCPSTCDAPNATPCKKLCEPVGCECNPGYLLSDNNGKCISADDCTGGNPCGPNASFGCQNRGCPSSYCPTDDSRAIAICEFFPFSPCLPGCFCKLNNRLLSGEDPRCILSQECPPVNCTRPNEIWNPCPLDCSSGYCEDVDKPKVTCNFLVLNCNPQCVCKKKFFRNPNTDICVSSVKCRKINASKH